MLLEDIHNAEINLIGKMIYGGITFSEETINQKTELTINVARQNLTSLYGMFKEVGTLIISENKLTSLKYAPEIVSRSEISCEHNLLTSLEYLPKTKNPLILFAKWNNLENLEGMPEICDTIDVNSNNLNSLKGCSKIIESSANFSINYLKSFEHAPEIVGKKSNPYEGVILSLNRNDFTTLHNIHKHIKECYGAIDLSKNQIKSHALGLLKIKGLSRKMMF